MEVEEEIGEATLKMVADDPVTAEIDEPFDLDAMIDGMGEEDQSLQSASQQVLWIHI